jgi:hypothetical protein
MEPASQLAGRDRVRPAARSRYGSLARAGFAGVSIITIRPAGGGIHAAIIRAAQS